MLQLACSWLGKLVVGVHVRDAGGCMEEKGHRLKPSRTEGSAGGWEHGWGALGCKALSVNGRVDCTAYRRRLMMSLRTRLHCMMDSCSSN